MMGNRLSNEEIVLMSGLLSKWSGCEFKICEAGPNVSDPLLERRGWIAAKDHQGLMDFISFTDDGLMNHSALSNRPNYINKAS